MNSRTKTDIEIKHSEIAEECRRHTEAILISSSRKKVVVAGPGTGKTFLFKEILQNKKKCLTLTFVNALVEDLSLELCGLSDVKTLHSFARGILSSQSQSIKIFPKLPDVIRQDAIILLEKEIDFNEIFHNLKKAKKELSFYKTRKDYYDKHYGYSDIVYALVRFFEEKSEKIPAYDLVLVDEFQDFNKLEISLIELLSQKSPILLAGDDDQALYGDLKSASPLYIRERFDGKISGYESFTLPYCRRCTKVIVEATNDVISNAHKNGFLKGRIHKEFKYYSHKEKDKISECNPRIIYSQQFDKQIPWFIEQQLNKIAEEIKNHFSVLIISPINSQSRHIIDSLRKKGFSNIESTEKKNDKEPNLIEGLKILLEDKDSNLGWRIVTKLLMDPQIFKSILMQSNGDNSKPFKELVNSGLRKEVVSLIKVMKAIANGKDVDPERLNNILDKLQLNPLKMAKDYLSEEIMSKTQRISNPGLRKISIKATTIQSSKGLSADYVFITHFDDKYLLNGNKPGDNTICNFLVALTRAKRKVFLVSSSTSDKPTFLGWIHGDRIEIVAKKGDLHFNRA
jgi:superfamily I DNA/RNA helicase